MAVWNKGSTALEEAFLSHAAMFAWTHSATFLLLLFVFLSFRQQLGNLCLNAWQAGCCSACMTVQGFPLW